MGLRLGEFAKNGLDWIELGCIWLYGFYWVDFGVNVQHLAELGEIGGGAWRNWRNRSELG